MCPSQAKDIIAACMPSSATHHHGTKDVETVTAGEPTDLSWLSVQGEHDVKIKGDLMTMTPDGEGGWLATDDVKGGSLDVEKVKAARITEMEYVFKRGVYKPSSLETALSVTGSKPIGTGWSDTNKGESRNPNYRSRLVAKEFKARRKAGLERLFAGTPPSESLRILLSEAVTEDDIGGRGDKEIVVIDVPRTLLREGPSAGLREDAS